MTLRISQGSALGASQATSIPVTLIVSAGAADGAASATGAPYALDAAIAVYSSIGAPVQPPYFHLNPES